MEDVGIEDITTNSIVPSEHHSHAKIIAKAAGVLAGQRFARDVFSFLDKEIEYTELKKDGDLLHPGEMISTITGHDTGHPYRGKGRSQYSPEIIGDGIPHKKIR